MEHEEIIHRQRQSRQKFAMQYLQKRAQDQSKQQLQSHDEDEVPRSIHSGGGGGGNNAANHSRDMGHGTASNGVLVDTSAYMFSNDRTYDKQVSHIFDQQLAGGSSPSLSTGHKHPVQRGAIVQEQAATRGGEDHQLHLPPQRVSQRLIQQHNESKALINQSDLVESGADQEEDQEPINFYKQRDSQSVQYMPDIRAISREEDVLADLVEPSAHQHFGAQKNDHGSRQSIKVYSSDAAFKNLKATKKRSSEEVEYATAPAGGLVHNRHNADEEFVMMDSQTTLPPRVATRPTSTIQEDQSSIPRLHQRSETTCEQVIHQTLDPQFITTSWSKPPTSSISKSRQFAMSHNQGREHAVDESQTETEDEAVAAKWHYEGQQHHYQQHNLHHQRSKPNQVSFKQKLIEEETAEESDRDTNRDLLVIEEHHSHERQSHGFAMPPRSVTHASLVQPEVLRGQQSRSHQKMKIERPSSASLLKSNLVGGKLQMANSHQNSQQRVKRIHMKKMTQMGTDPSRASLNNAQHQQQSHSRRHSAAGSRTLLGRQSRQRRTPSESPVLQAEMTQDMYASTSDEADFDQNENRDLDLHEQQRLTRGVSQKRMTPFRRSVSAKSVRSTRSKKSIKSQKQLRTQQTSRSRSSRGSRHAAKKLGRRSKNGSVHGIATGNYTTLSLPVLKPLKESSKRSTNIIIKGALTAKTSTVKASKKATASGSGKKQPSASSKKEKQTSDLMEKLLNEITSKYKPHLCKDRNYMEKLEKKTMIQEIQMLAQALISCDRAQKKQQDNNDKVVKRLQSELLASEEQVKTCLKRQMKLEKEFERVSITGADLLEQLQNQDAMVEDMRRRHAAERDQLEAEKSQIAATLTKEKEDSSLKETSKFERKLNQLKSMNAELSQKVLQSKKTEEELQVVSDELAQVKQEFLKAHQSAEEQSKANYMLEQKVLGLQSEVKQARSRVVDSVESERNNISDKVLSMQMTMKVKDEQIMSLKHEIKILENRLKTRMTEMSQQKQTLNTTHEEGKKMEESHQSEIELKDLAIQRMERQLADHEEELSQVCQKAEVKLTKTKERYEAMVTKLNEVVQSQLGDIQNLRSTNQGLETKIGEMEKEALLREVGQAPLGQYSTLNTSKGGGSVELGGGPGSLRELRKEDLALIDELGDQVKTKEEEIQILWNVIKEINKVKGGNINLSQLQKMIIRSETAALRQSNQSETLHQMFATPGHVNTSTRY